MRSDQVKTVRAADRVLDLLLCLGTADELSLTQIAAQTSLSKSTTHRLLDSLEGAGLAEYQTATKTYRLGVRVLQLAHQRSRASSLATLAEPILRRLCDETGETACLQVRSGIYRVCLQQVESRHDVRRAYTIGQPLAIYAGAIGKALMAFLPPAEVEGIIAATGLKPLTAATVSDAAAMRRELERIRCQGWAISAGERVPEASNLSAPVFGAHGGVVAAIGISGPSSRFTVQQAVAAVPHLLRGARELSELLGAPASGAAGAAMPLVAAAAAN